MQLGEEKLPFNGLALSCAASIDWEDDRADSICQNRDDLARRSAASAPSHHPARRDSSTSETVP